MRAWFYIIHLILIILLIATGYLWVEYKNVQADQANARGKTIINIQEQLGYVNNQNEHIKKGDFEHAAILSEHSMFIARKWIDEMQDLDPEHREEWYQIRTAMFTVTEQFSQITNRNNANETLTEDQLELLEDIDQLFTKIMQALPDEASTNAEPRYFRVSFHINQVDRLKLKEAASAARRFQEKWDSHLEGRNHE